MGALTSLSQICGHKIENADSFKNNKLRFPDSKPRTQTELNVLIYYPYTSVSI